MYLAPIRSIRVEESSDFEKVTTNDVACGSCTLTQEREFTFRLFLLGGGSLESAWSIQRRIVAQLQLACSQQILLYRKVQDETALQYKVVKGTIRMVDTIDQFTCERILALELVLTLVSVPGLVSPLVVGVTLMQPTVVLVNTQAMTPLAVVVSLVQPDVTLDMDIDPLVVTVTLVEPTVVLV